MIIMKIGDTVTLHMRPVNARKIAQELMERASKLEKIQKNEQKKSHAS